MEFKEKKLKRSKQRQVEREVREKCVRERGRERERERDVQREGVTATGTRRLRGRFASSRG